MSLEFAVQYPCVLRARYSEKHLREWGRLSNLHARLTTGDTSAPSEDKLEWVERARSEVEVMQVETAVCLSCPACLPIETAGEGESVGCLGRITYPIEAEFEKFLADRVQLALDTLDQQDQPRLLRILVDPESPFDGEATKELRRVTTGEGLRFFELRLPIVLSREAATITTDHVFDLLAGFRSEDSEQTSYTRELPFAATADYYDFLDLILRNDLNQSEAVRLKARSKNYSQFLRLLTGIERAEALNTRVLLD
jgi:BMFP domain-containing protein YqiC